jgi:RimJ/RimL family protein N-acetyltransferase
MQLTATILIGRFVRLEPVTAAHRAALQQAIDVDAEAWSLMSVNGSGAQFDDFWGSLLGETIHGKRIGYAIYDLAGSRIIGTTSFLNLQPAHGGVEIGATFLHPDARSGPVNPDAKRLMLGHAFACGAIRVEFVVDERNQRSQAAVLKLGATKEGVLRNHKITWTGYRRDSGIYSILDREWPEVERRLELRLEAAFDKRGSPA